MRQGLIHRLEVFANDLFCMINTWKYNEVLTGLRSLAYF